jgi:hypothetical protein
MNNYYFVKSTEDDFFTKTLKGKKKVSFQSIENMIKTKTIKPNTKSFSKEKRLACTLLDKNYLKTYRPQGIIFQTNAKPNEIYPFDMVLLSNAKKIVVQYYRIKNNLHLYYNHNLIPGFEKFIFKDYKTMLLKIKSPRVAWRLVNDFRVKNNFDKLPKEKYRLVEYNEIVFTKPIKIKPIAIFGYKKESRNLAKKLKLKHYISAKSFFNKMS